MPGKGEARERDYTPEERAALAQGVEALGLSLEAAPPLSPGFVEVVEEGGDAA